MFFGFKTATRLRPLVLGLLGSVVMALCATAISDDAAAREQQWVRSATIPVHGITWNLLVWPTPDKA